MHSSRKRKIKKANRYQDLLGFAVIAGRSFSLACQGSFDCVSESECCLFKTYKCEYYYLIFFDGFKTT